MRAELVVLAAPALDQHLRLEQRVEGLVRGAFVEREVELQRLHSTFAGCGSVVMLVDEVEGSATACRPVGAAITRKRYGVSARGGRTSQGQALVRTPSP